MRPSAEIGSEKMTRSTRVWRANSTRSSTVPSFGTPLQVCRAAVVAAIVKYADDAHVGIALRRECCDQRIAAIAGADHDGATIEAALPCPAAHQEEQGASKPDERKQSDHIKTAEPDPGKLIAGLGEVRHGDGEQKYHRPRRREPHILFFVTAKGLDLIDVGGLERQQRKQRDPGDGADIVAGGIGEWRDRPEIKRKSDRRHQRDLDHPDDAGDNDWRIRVFESLCGDRQCGG